MILVHIFNGKGKLMVAVIFRPETLNYLVLGVLPLGKQELPGLDSQAGAWEAANFFLPVLPVLRVFVVKNNFRFMLFFSGDSIFLFLS